MNPLALLLAPVLSIASATPDGASALHIRGTVEHASAPPVLRLRAENGCAREAKLSVTTTGKAFSAALTADDLADAFACAVDAESGEASLSTIAIAPDATASASSDLVLAGWFAVAAADLDPRAGYLVRFAISSASSAHAVQGALITLDGKAYAARIAPPEEGRDGATDAIFDIPARAWAMAVVTKSAAHVDVQLEGNTHHTMTLRPTTRVELISDDAEDTDDSTETP